MENPYKHIYTKTLSYDGKWVDALLGLDYNGEHVITVFFTGYPVMVISEEDIRQENVLTSDVQYFITTPTTLNQAFVLMDFLYELGCVSEDNYQTKFMESPDNLELFGVLIDTMDEAPFRDLLIEILHAREVYIEEPEADES